MAPNPIVAMMTATIGRPSSGRRTTRSRAKLNSTMTATAAMIAARIGIPSTARHAGRDEASQHHELALGEIDGVGGLVDEHEPQRDQRVHQADRQSAHDEREGE